MPFNWLKISDMKILVFDIWGEYAHFKKIYDWFSLNYRISGLQITLTFNYASKYKIRCEWEKNKMYRF